MATFHSVDRPSLSHSVDESGAGRPLKFVLSSVPSDSHMWNLVALQMIMEEMGHEVVNLGACVPVERLLDRCRAETPDCLVISTINGHGHVDGAQVITQLRMDPQLAGLPAVIGGKLGLLGDGNTDLRAELLGLGFDEVFHVGSGDSGQAVDAFRAFIAASLRPVR